MARQYLFYFFIKDTTFFFFNKDRVQHVFRLQHKEPANICLCFNYNGPPELKLNLFQYH